MIFPHGSTLTGTNRKIVVRRASDLLFLTLTDPRAEEKPLNFQQLDIFNRQNRLHGSCLMYSVSIHIVSCHLVWIWLFLSSVGIEHDRQVKCAKYVVMKEQDLKNDAFSAWLESGKINKKHGLPPEIADVMTT